MADLLLIRHGQARYGEADYDRPETLDAARTGLARFENFHLAGRTGLFWYNNMDHSMECAMQLVHKLLRGGRLSERSVGNDPVRASG